MPGRQSNYQTWLFDALIRLLLFAAIAIVLELRRHFWREHRHAPRFFLEWLYPVVFEVYSNGATPGKKLCNIQVLHDDGTPIGWGASFSRNTLRFIDFLPFFYACGLLTMWLNQDSKRLGDLLAGTVVVYRMTTRYPPLTTAISTLKPHPFHSACQNNALIEYRQRAAK